MHRFLTGRLVWEYRMARWFLFVSSCVLSLNVYVALGQSNTTTPPEFVDFHVTDYAKFTCRAKGFRCGYLKDDYASVEIAGGSQDSVGSLGGEDNNVWSPLGNVDDALTLENCTIDYCFVRCNYGCSCVLQDGNTTCEAGTAPPTAAPPSEPPQVCSVTKNTQLCSKMEQVAPAGTNYDCYNFCGNEFESYCDFGGACADATCSNVGADGTVQGLILGCTWDDLRGMSGANNGGTSGARNGVTRPVTGFILIIAAAVLGL